MVDRFIFVLVIAVIPGAILTTAYRWLSIELGLSVVWATVIVTIAIGLWKYWHDPEAYDRPGK